MLWLRSAALSSAAGRAVQATRMARNIEIKARCADWSLPAACDLTGHAAELTQTTLFTCASG
jgi:hypothetical protein